MKYTNAKHILPNKLIKEIQQHIQGETLYIPKQEKADRKWGSLNGGRQWIDRRNADIRQAFSNNKSIEQLAKDYFLSVDTIRRIVYTKQKK
ncbi:Mor family transcriptional regulator [Croceifilum oryzae]|uniref:Mor family transcriptional regulator n=1 Tax=Croceifilum oryzae TaxID=1553429 RepID=A0AAJ1TI71_9BACL|nr:CD3324 family protein [Croceifilum oryzae]MDQ0416434.1 Mor family transcriptional regulator [Croceifilum oryzae]